MICENNWSEEENWRMEESWPENDVWSEGGAVHGKVPKRIIVRLVKRQMKHVERADARKKWSASEEEVAWRGTSPHDSVKRRQQGEMWRTLPCETAEEGCTHGDYQIASYYPPAPLNQRHRRNSIWVYSGSTWSKAESGQIVKQTAMVLICIDLMFKRARRTGEPCVPYLL